jgi:hypothetical protein
MAHTYDFTGWTVPSLLRLQASWAEIITSTEEERQAQAQASAQLEEALQRALAALQTTPPAGEEKCEEG